MGLFRKVFSCFSTSQATGGTIGPCDSGICSPPPPPSRVDVEELENRHGFGPWLMFADEENDEPGGTGVRRCYSFLSKEIFSLPAPQLQGRRCWGTQYGWLITCPRYNGEVHLFNPLTHHQLFLPSNLSFRKLPPYCNDPIAFFDRFSLSSNTDRLVVMTMHGRDSQLAFTSLGAQAWMPLCVSQTSAKFDTIFCSGQWKSFIESQTTAKFDTIFYSGQFYSIDRMANFKVCDFTSGKLEEKLIDNSFLARAHRTRPSELYLVEISGHLHLICRFYIRSKTRRFSIYRFDFQKTKWIAINDLHAHSLFVGNNTSFAISATDYPEIKPDCIYFTDEYSANCGRPFCDMGVYDFAAKSVIEYFTNAGKPYSRFSRPFFFIPSLSTLR